MPESESKREQALKPLHLSPQEFAESFRTVPRIAVNLVAKDSEGRVLLVRRNIPPQEGAWHMPGGFILKNETIEACRDRVAEKELGIQISKDAHVDLLGVFDDIDKDPRGHVIDLAFGVSLDEGRQIPPSDENSEARFFDKLPENMGFNHRDTLHALGFQDNEAFPS